MLVPKGAGNALDKQYEQLNEQLQKVLTADWCCAQMRFQPMLRGRAMQGYVA